VAVVLCLPQWLPPERQLKPESGYFNYIRQKRDAKVTQLEQTQLQPSASGGRPLSIRHISAKAEKTETSRGRLYTSFFASGLHTIG